MESINQSINEKNQPSRTNKSPKTSIKITLILKIQSSPKIICH